jgi:hypothetical protein
MPSIRLASLQNTAVHLKHPIKLHLHHIQTAVCTHPLPLAGITRATLCVNTPGGKPDNPHARLPALTGLSKYSPALRELQLLLSGRSAYEAVTEAMGGIQQLAGLQALTLQFVVSATPKKGMWPMFFSDNMQLGKLRRLVVEGSSMPPLAVSVSGSSAVLAGQLSWPYSCSGVYQACAVQWLADTTSATGRPTSMWP